MSGNRTGVLKTGAIQFDPPLPAEKQNAIESLGVGLLNKCFVCNAAVPSFFVKRLGRAAATSVCVTLAVRCLLLIF